MNALPETLEKLVQTWIKSEYFKRTSAGQAHSNICELLKDEEKMRNILANFGRTENSDDEDDSEAEDTNLTDSEESSDEESDDNPDIPSSPDDRESLVHFEDFEDAGHYSLPSPMPDHLPVDPHWNPFEVEEVQEWRENYDPIYPIEKVKEIYEKLARKEFQILKRTRNPLELEDILKILIIRHNFLFQQDYSKYFKFPLKILNIYTDFWKMKFQLYSDPEEDPLNLQYWFDPNGCLIWYEDTVRFVSQSSYQKSAAEDLYLLMTHPKMRFQELNFDVEPYTRGPKEYPSTRVFDKLASLLRPRIPESSLEHNLDPDYYPDFDPETKIHVRSLFFKTCRGFNLQNNPLPGILTHFQPGYLKSLVLPTWDDSGVIDKEDQWMNVHSDYWYLKFFAIDFVWEEKLARRVWNEASHLDIQDIDVIPSYSSESHYVERFSVDENSFCSSPTRKDV